MGERRQAVAAPAAEPAAPVAATSAPVSPAAAAPRPALTEEVPEVFLPARAGEGLRYEPHLLGLAKVHYVDRKSKKEVHCDELSLLVPLDETMIDLDWEEAEESELDERDLEKEPAGDAAFGALPEQASKKRSYATWTKELSAWLYRGRSLELFESPTFKLVSDPHEGERDFRVRLGDLAREQRDEEIARLRKRFESKAGTLEERIRKAAQRVEKEKEQAGSQKLQAAISVGATLLAAFTGRKKLSYSTLSRATTAARGFGRASEQAKDISRAQETVEALTQQLEELNAELEAEIDKLEERFDPAAEKLETIALRPRKSDIDVRLVALAWRPAGL